MYISLYATGVILVFHAKIVGGLSLKVNTDIRSQRSNCTLCMYFCFFTGYSRT